MKLPIYAIVSKQDNKSLLHTTSGQIFSSPSKVLLEQRLSENESDYKHAEVKLIEEVELIPDDAQSEDEKEMLSEFRHMALNAHGNHSNVGPNERLKEFKNCRMTFCQRRYKMCRYSETEVI